MQKSYEGSTSTLSLGHFFFNYFLNIIRIEAIWSSGGDAVLVGKQCNKEGILVVLV